MVVVIHVHVHSCDTRSLTRKKNNCLTLNWIKSGCRSRFVDFDWGWKCTRWIFYFTYMYTNVWAYCTVKIVNFIYFLSGHGNKMYETSYLVTSYHQCEICQINVFAQLNFGKKKQRFWGCVNYTSSEYVHRSF